MTEANPFLDDADDDDEEGETEGTEGNATIAEIRKAQRRAERTAKKQSAELDMLRAFKAEKDALARQGLVESVFKEAKLDPVYADLFAAKNPDAEVTAELVTNFAAQYKLPTLEGGTVEAAEKDPGYNPVTAGGGPSLKTYTRAELETLIYTDPELANRVIAEGRTELNG